MNIIDRPKGTTKSTKPDRVHRREGGNIKNVNLYPAAPFLSAVDGSFLTIFQKHPVSNHPAVITFMRNTADSCKKQGPSKKRPSHFDSDALSIVVLKDLST